MKQPKKRGRPRTIKILTEEEQREKWRIATAKYRASAKGKAAYKEKRKDPAFREIARTRAALWNQKQLRERGEEFREKERKRQNLLYATNAEFRQRRAEYQRMKLSGMTPEFFNALVKIQNCRCAICYVELQLGTKQVHADHCHDSGNPRGLLCKYCNLIEGMITNVKLSPLEFGQRLHKYLENPPANQCKQVISL
jgi:hypothetical protein